MESQSPVLLFDGVCNLCDGAVQFVIKNDRKRKFKFASLQSAFGQALLERLEMDKQELTSLIVLDEGRAYTHSGGALRVAKLLGGVWSMMYVFVIIPKPLRDKLYNWVARNRYRWFGKKDACMMPSPEVRSRFLD